MGQGYEYIHPECTVGSGQLLGYIYMALSDDGKFKRGDISLIDPYENTLATIKLLDDAVSCAFQGEADADPLEFKIRMDNDGVNALKKELKQLRQQKVEPKDYHARLAQFFNTLQTSHLHSVLKERGENTEIPRTLLVTDEDGKTIGNVGVVCKSNRTITAARTPFYGELNFTPLAVNQSGFFISPDSVKMKIGDKTHDVVTDYDCNEIKLAVDEHFPDIVGALLRKVLAAPKDERVVAVKDFMDQLSEHYAELSSAQALLDRQIKDPRRTR